MLKASLMYPLELGQRFDLDYYCDKHMPLVQELLGSCCKKIEVDQGLVGMDVTTPSPYVAVGHIYFDSVEEFKRAYAMNSEAIKKDRSNYTDIEPIIMFSRVRL